MRDRIIAGDTLDFVTTLPDYPAATYTLKYRLIPRTSGTAIEITCTAGTDPNDHRCGASATATALWTAGEYSWASWVEKAGERYQVDSGTVTLLPNPATATAYDGRSTAQKALDDAEAALATFQASGGKVKRYSIGGREMEFSEGGELLKQISYWSIQVKRERAKDAAAKGMADPRRIYLRANRA
jgi:hypothetical protein